MKRVYLAGPIHGRTDEDCMDWRESARVLLYADGAANRLGVLDPMRRDYRDQREGQLETMREIIVLDNVDSHERTGRLESRSLASALTSTVWKDRVLNPSVIAICSTRFVLARISAEIFS